MRRLALALGLLATASCVPRALAPPLERWESAHGRDHPLAGRIWCVADARFVDPAGLVRRLQAVRFVLLGEQHDNADHHRLQAWVLRGLIARGRRPAVGFEMLSLDAAPALERHLTGRPGDAAGLGEAVGWSRAGWPAWRLYQPIAEAALEAGLPIVATDLERATVEAVRSRGLDAMDPAWRARLGLDRPLAPATHGELVAELTDAHCGQAPAAALDRMVAVQRARDAHMAWRLVAAGRGGAVLIAGAGHVRRDRGIPAALTRLEPQVTVASLAFLEVRAGATEPDAYAVRFSGGGRALPYDYVWFTPRREEADPCERFRRPLERLRDRS